MSVLLFGATSLWGQGSGKLTGKILSIKNQPVSGAIVTVLDTVNVTTSKAVSYTHLTLPTKQVV